MREYPANDAGAPTLVFGHGAGAGEEHPWIVRVARDLAAHGVRVVTFNFPYRAEGRKLPDKPPVLEAAFQAAWNEVVAADRKSGRADAPYFAGGKSMGARIASQAAARRLLSPAPAGLVFFGYPLHPPGKPGQRRDAHLPDIVAPMLFLHGTRDPFGSPDEMRELTLGASARAKRATLEVIDGGDHSLIAPKSKDPKSLERAITFAANWIVSVSQARSTPEVDLRD